jgi:hypothetical protein
VGEGGTVLVGFASGVEVSVGFGSRVGVGVSFVTSVGVGVPGTRVRVLVGSVTAVCVDVAPGVTRVVSVGLVAGFDPLSAVDVGVGDVAAVGARSNARSSRAAAATIAGSSRGRVP